MVKKKTSEAQLEKGGKSKKRTYLSQSDVPTCILEEAIRIPRAIADNYAFKPITPLQLASALNMTPTSGSFRMLCGAAIAYDLVKGGCNAKEITITPLGKRIVASLAEGDDLVAKRDAVLKPRILNEFITKYSEASLPRHDIAINVLVDLGVPREKGESVYTLILENAQSVSFIKEIKGKSYIDLTGSTFFKTDEAAITDENQNESALRIPEPKESENLITKSPTRILSSIDNRRVFITHGKNKSFVDPIKKLLGFGELTPIVSVEKQSVSKPVPDKVMEDMRSCGAGIIHVDTEQTLFDKNGKEHLVINSNVLIEIGAAMALYGRRYILLVREGVILPSNLQGLYEVRYKGDSLDGEATLKLMESIKDIKENPVPNRET